jgi:hypothetical protein
LRLGKSLKTKNREGKNVGHGVMIKLVIDVNMVDNIGHNVGHVYDGVLDVKRGQYDYHHQWLK